MPPCQIATSKVFEQGAIDLIMLYLNIRIQTYQLHKIEKDTID